MFTMALSPPEAPCLLTRTTLALQSPWGLVTRLAPLSNHKTRDTWCLLYYSRETKLYKIIVSVHQLEDRYVSD